MKHKIEILDGNWKDRVVYFAGAALISGNDKIVASSINIKAVSLDHAEQRVGAELEILLLHLFVEITGEDIDMLAMMKIRTYQAIDVQRSVKIQYQPTNVSDVLKTTNQLFKNKTRDCGCG